MNHSGVSQDGLLASSWMAVATHRMAHPPASMLYMCETCSVPGDVRAGEHAERPSCRTGVLLAAPAAFDMPLEWAYTALFCYVVHEPDSSVALKA